MVLVLGQAAGVMVTCWPRRSSMWTSLRMWAARRSSGILGRSYPLLASLVITEGGADPLTVEQTVCTFDTRLRCSSPLCRLARTNRKPRGVAAGGTLTGDDAAALPGAYVSGRGITWE
jgi:hypothetical protein